ncbi:MAG: hypothetical protein ACOCP4_01105 [Candidatus Woesearchaeota archaeon]
MKQIKKNQLRYRNDLSVKIIRDNIRVIGSYIGLVMLWAYTISYQTSLANLMNVGVFMMWALGSIATFIIKEDKENTIKITKWTIFYYLAIIFVYDMFLKAVITDMAYSAGSTDAAGETAKRFLTYVSILGGKIGIPLGYIVWVISKFKTYTNHITKHKQIQNLRDVRSSYQKDDKTSNNRRF